jgi:hypothetical protein
MRSKIKLSRWRVPVFLCIVVYLSSANRVARRAEECGYGAVQVDGGWEALLDER